MTDDTDHFTCLDFNGNVFKYGIVGFITEGNILDVDIALNTDINREADIGDFRAFFENFEDLGGSGQEVGDDTRQGCDGHQRCVDHVRIRGDLGQLTHRHTVLLVQQRVAVEQDEVVTDVNEGGEQRENGIEQLGVGFVLSCSTGGGLIELFNGGIFLTVTLDDTDTVEDVLQQIRGSRAEDPGLDIAAADDLPELGDQIDNQRNRNGDEQRDQRIHEQNDDQRNNEGCNVDEQGRNLVNDERLYDGGIGVDTLHQVTGRLSLQRGKRQGGDLFVQKRTHDEDKAVTGDGGHTRLEYTERTGEEVD